MLKINENALLKYSEVKEKAERAIDLIKRRRDQDDAKTRLAYSFAIGVIEGVFGLNSLFKEDK